jgi:hypothetical protein
MIAPDRGEGESLVPRGTGNRVAVIDALAEGLVSRYAGFLTSPHNV